MVLRGRGEGMLLSRNKGRVPWGEASEVGKAQQHRKNLCPPPPPQNGSAMTPPPPNLLSSWPGLRQKSCAALPGKTPRIEPRA